jgi:hypothetical protein
MPKRYNTTANQITSTNPAVVNLQTQIVKLDTTAADAVGFEAFILPKGCIPISAWTYNAVSNAAQTINLGSTLGGTDLINAVPTSAVGFAQVGTTAGTLFGAPVTTDTLIYAKASAQLTSAVYVRVDFYRPPQGFTW